MSQAAARRLLDPFRRAALFAVLILAAPALPAAAAERLEIAAAKSKLTFVLGATGHEVRGELPLVGGEIVIDAAKIRTGSEGRDEKMHAEVLLSAKFPKILFRPQKLEGRLPASGKGKIGLRGKIELVGVEHELLLPAEVEIAGNRISATSVFEIPFVAWGLHDPSVLFLRVDKQIAVRLEIEGELFPAP